MSKNILKTFLDSDNKLDFEAYQKHAIEELQSRKPLLGEDGIATPLIKNIIEASLDAELDYHLKTQATASNRRNGKTRKTMQSSTGPFELESTRDREASFEPKLIKKRQTILNASLDNKILGLYGIGMSHRDISDHLQELYDVEISPATITAITNKLIPIIEEWRSRPLESVYPIVFLDAMFFKVRENGKVVSKALYNILGVDQSGRKEILGFYLVDTDSAHFWLGVLNDLKARGVQDILIACVDGLVGFPEAIEAAFPQTEVQLCIVHQIRNSLKYIASKDQKEFLQDLKTVYRAETKDLAKSNLDKLD